MRCMWYTNILCLLPLRQKLEMERTLPPKETPMPMPSEKEWRVITRTSSNACAHARSLERSGRESGRRVGEGAARGGARGMSVCVRACARAYARGRAAACLACVDDVEDGHLHVVVPLEKTLAHCEGRGASRGGSGYAWRGGAPG